MQSTKNGNQFLTESEVDEEIRRLEEKEQELKLGNQRMKNQINDLRDLIKVVDTDNDSNVRQQQDKSQKLEAEIDALQAALKVQQNEGSHLQNVSNFFNQN